MAEQNKPTATELQNTSEQNPSTSSSSHPAPITISNCSHHCVHPDCCCHAIKKPPTKTSVGPKKAAAVLTSAEIDRMIDLGLGRGIDSTNPKPWMNKSAFQVRRVTAEGVLGTEEGGSLQSYEREVRSTISHQTDLKASVVVPKAPVQIGIDAEQSRSVSSTRRAVGKKVINRTVSFRADFSDVPFISHDHSVDFFSLHDTHETVDSVADMQSEYYTFEERLSKWIVKRILQRQELTAQEMKAANLEVGEPKFVVDKSLGPTDPLSLVSHFIYLANEEEKKKIIHDCYDFVTHFRVTHYVSSIELGATEYRVFSETDFNSRIGAGGSLAVEKLANLSVSHKRSSRKLKKASDVKTIGKITGEGSVGRGMHDEAVVGIRVEPIPTLVKLPYLQLALRRALVYYMEEQGDSSSGPFLIAFGSEKSLHYWSVSENYAVYGTSNPRNASLFFIIPNDSGKHPHEFHIVYMGDNRQVLRKRVSSLTPLSQKPIEAISRYLNARVSVCGTNFGPLHLDYHVSDGSRLMLFSRVCQDEGPISTQSWVQGCDMFFINCARRTMKKDGYIGMKRRQRYGEEEWITACFPRRHDHNDRSVFMLFRLLPASFRDRDRDTTGFDNLGEATPFDDFDNNKSLDEQLASYGRGTAPDAFRAPPSPLPQRKPKLPATSEDSKRSVKSGILKSRIRFGTSGGDALTVPESEFHLPILSDPVQPTIIAAEDTTHL